MTIVRDMRRPVSYALTVMMLGVLVATSGHAGEPHKHVKLKAGWTRESVQAASDECTEALVQGTWDNTKREQGVDAATSLTDEIRKQIAPQIAAMKKLCACAVREGAKRYTKAEAEVGPADLERAVSESISNGTCKVAP